MCFKGDRRCFFLVEEPAILVCKHENVTVAQLTQHGDFWERADKEVLRVDNENVYFFCKFFKSLMLLLLWIWGVCGFMGYLVFWLYPGCMDFFRFLQSQFITQSQLTKFEFSKQI